MVLRVKSTMIIFYQTFPFILQLACQLRSLGRNTYYFRGFEGHNLYWNGLRSGGEKTGKQEQAKKPACDLFSFERAETVGGVV